MQRLSMPVKTKAYEHRAANRTNIPTDRDRVFMSGEDREKIEFTPPPKPRRNPEVRSSVGVVAPAFRLSRAMLCRSTSMRRSIRLRSSSS